MAQVKKIQTLKVKLKPEPGSWSTVFSAFKGAGVNVVASWAYEMGPGDAEGIVYPSDLNKAKAALTKLGLSATPMTAVYAEDTDKVGIYADLLAKIAAAGVNLAATDAFGVGGRFATVFFADEKDVPALCKALGC